MHVDEQENEEQSGKSQAKSVSSRRIRPLRFAEVDKAAARFEGRSSGFVGGCSSIIPALLWIVGGSLLKKSVRRLSFNKWSVVSIAACTAS